MQYSTLLTILSLTAAVTAKTDFEGCTSTMMGRSQVFYVPETGEVCDFLQCGGGRGGPVKSTVPGCPAYTGTASYEPTYLPGYGPGQTPVQTTAQSTATASTKHEETTPAPTSTTEMETHYPESTSTSTAVEHTSSASSSSAYSSSTEEETKTYVSSSMVTSAVVTSKYTTMTAGPTGMTTAVVGGSGNATVSGSVPSSTSFEGAASPLKRTGQEILGLAVGIVAGVLMF